MATTMVRELVGRGKRGYSGVSGMRSGTHNNDNEDDKGDNHTNWQPVLVGLAVAAVLCGFMVYAYWRQYHKVAAIPTSTTVTDTTTTLQTEREREREQEQPHPLDQPSEMAPARL